MRKTESKNNTNVKKRYTFFLVSLYVRYVNNAPRKNIEYNTSFLTLQDGLVSIKGVAMIFGASPQPIALFIGNFLLSFFVGNLIYMVAFALGEEYGWRGHLQPLLLQKYAIKQAFVVLGIIWGLWHLPAILLGHNYPEYPLLGGFVLMPITCIAFSVAFGAVFRWLLRPAPHTTRRTTTVASPPAAPANCPVR